MSRRYKLGTFVFFVLLMLAFAATLVSAAHHEGKDKPTKHVCAMGGPMMSDQAGHCACGEPLVEKKVLKEDDEYVYVCACGPKCDCDIDPADDSKCACGKPLQAFAKANQPAGCKGHGSTGAPPCDMNHERMGEKSPCRNCANCAKKTE